MKFYSNIDRFFSGILVNFFFRLGFIISVIAFFIVPEPFNFIIFVLYIILWILRMLGLKPKIGGYIIEKSSGVPLSFALIRIYHWGSENQLLQKVANKNGKYFCLLSPGEYYLKIEKKNPDGSYTPVHTSYKITAKKGVIDKYFKV